MIWGQNDSKGRELVIENHKLLATGKLEEE